MTKWSTLLLAGVVAAAVSSAQAEEKPAPPALNFTMKSITGQDVNLADYKGKVVLVVNVASKCPLVASHNRNGVEGAAVTRTVASVLMPALLIGFPP